MAEAKLAVLVVFADSVNMSLSTDEEAKVEAAGNSTDLDRVTKWHLDRLADFLTL